MRGSHICYNLGNDNYEVWTTRKIDLERDYPNTEIIDFQEDIELPFRFTEKQILDITKHVEVKVIERVFTNRFAWFTIELQLKDKNIGISDFDIERIRGLIEATENTKVKKVRFVFWKSGLIVLDFDIEE